MSDREQLVKKLKAAEQELGVVRYKLKGRKDDKSNYKEELNKLKNENTDLRLEIADVRKVNNKLYSQNSILKGAINIINYTAQDAEEFEKAMKLA